MRERDEGRVSANKIKFCNLLVFHKIITPFRFRNPHRIASFFEIELKFQQIRKKNGSEASNCGRGF